MSIAVVAVAQAQTKSSPKTTSEARRVRIPGGSYTPLYKPNKIEIAINVAEFLIDRYPVTNGEFIVFVQARPEWSKQRAPALYRDEKYLGHWSGTPAHPKKSELSLAVTQVSWFAAEEYCEWKGGRLPTVDQWEYVAAADETTPDATRKPEFVDKLLAWYSETTHAHAFQPVGQGRPNFFDVEDLHNLVWEWTYDFNSVFVTGDNRQDADDMKNLFCGGAAASAQNKSDYAAFMRYALRNSLQASYTLERLGFRCAYEK